MGTDLPQEGNRTHGGGHWKLSRETVDAILESVRHGAKAKDAAAAAGVSKATLYRWLELAEREEPEDTEDLERWGLARDLRDRLESGRAQAKVDALAKIREAWEGGTWTAAAWFLERTYPEDYSRRIVEIGGAESSGPVRVAIDRQSLEALIANPAALMAAQEASLAELADTPAGRALLGDEAA